ncbi:MAG: Ig domain-containing protein [Candidatus Korobacteraceae bacterium]
MRASRILALSSLATILCVFLAACGGGGSTPKPPAGPPTVTSSLLTQATVNVVYSFYLQASGGTGTYTWAITSGSLPPGLTFNTMTAQISGTPTLLGNYPFSVKVTDQNNLSGTANLTLLVGGALVIDCNSCITGTRLPTGNPGVPYSAMLTVSGGVTPYTWCVIETSGACDNGAGGALPVGLTLSTDSNGDGIISGTPTNVPAAPAQFTLQVTDSEVPPAVSTIPLTLTIIGILTPALSPAVLNVPYSQNLTVSGGVIPYTWSITSGTLPPGLAFQGNCVDTRQPNCTISGVPTMAGTYPFTVQVKDSENPPATASAQFTIVVTGITNGTLNGNYVFSFTGYEGSNNSPVVMSGAFVADGNGNITGGELDLNDGTGEANTGCHNNGPQQQTITPAPSSTYSIQPNGLGAMTVVTNSGTYNFAVAIRPDGSGSLIQNNADPNTRGSGTIKVQVPGVTTAQIEGNFALGITGADATGNRYVAAGQYKLEDPNGDLSCTGSNTCPLDADDGGTASQHTFAGTLSTTLDSFGRGCFVNLTFDGNHNNVYIYAYYIVSDNELVIVSTDPVGGSKNANLALWSTLRQVVGASGFSNGTLAQTTVLELGARDANGQADVTAGLFIGQGTTGHSCQGGNYDGATFNFDENQGGTLSQQQSSQGTYCVDSATGRVMLTGFNGLWSTAPPVFYLGGNDPGFVVGTDDASTSGNLEVQTGGPYTNASVSNDYWGGTLMPAVSAVTDSVTALIADGVGDITATQYISGPGGPGGPNTLTLVYSVDSTGRGVVMQNGNLFGILYVVGPNKFILLPVGSTPALNVFASAPGF